MFSFAKIFILIFMTVFLFEISFAKQGCSGCCSKHDGIRGCDSTTGRIICNDGEPSPNCMCDCMSASKSNQQEPSVNSFAKQGCSGCCSWHGGIRGCDSTTGRIICNDGEHSPSCTCDCMSESKFNRQEPFVRKNNQLSCICSLDDDKFGSLCGRRSMYSFSPEKYINICYPTASSSS